MYENDVEPAFKKMIGKVVKSVQLSPGNQTIKFEFRDGTEQAFGVEGDCCSSSWIEHLEMPNDVVGATILRIEEGGGAPWDDHQCVNFDYDDPRYDEGCGHDSLKVYATNFATDHGTIVLEYRNDSNGYYGGYLVLA